MILEIKERPVREAHNLATNYETIIWTIGFSK
jgi:hypothetical protein